MHGAIPTEEAQKTILNAGDYIEDQLFSYLIEKYPNSKFNKNMVRRFKKNYSFVRDTAEEVREGYRSTANPSCTISNTRSSGLRKHSSGAHRDHHRDDREVRS